MEFPASRRRIAIMHPTRDASTAPTALRDHPERRANRALGASEDPKAIPASPAVTAFPALPERPDPRVPREIVVKPVPPERREPMRSDQLDERAIEDHPARADPRDHKERRARMHHPALLAHQDPQGHPALKDPRVRPVMREERELREQLERMRSTALARTEVAAAVEELVAALVVVAAAVLEVLAEREELDPTVVAKPKKGDKRNFYANFIKLFCHTFINGKF
jgi:hypothetical protein